MTGYRGAGNNKSLRWHDNWWIRNMLSNVRYDPDYLKKILGEINALGGSKEYQIIYMGIESTIKKYLTGELDDAALKEVFDGLRTLTLILYDGMLSRGNF